MITDNSFFVVSRYNEDISWINDYTSNYIIYNKGNDLDPKYNSIKLPNFGGNQHDMFYFVVANYDNLPEIMVFVQGNPFDHCNKNTFDKIVVNKSFTPLEDYSQNKENDLYKKDIDGGYMEFNNS